MSPRGAGQDPARRRVWRSSSGWAASSCSGGRAAHFGDPPAAGPLSETDHFPGKDLFYRISGITLQAPLSLRQRPNDLRTIMARALIATAECGARTNPSSG